MPSENGKVMYFPFWRIKADVSGIQLNSYGDLIRVANLPRVARESRKETEFYFWVLAFKLRPQFFLNFSRNITLSQPQQPLESELPKAPLYPVTLSFGEAAESLKVNLVTIIRPRSKIPEIIRDLQVTPKDVKLVYIPFQEGHHEYIQSMFQISIHKNILAMAGNL